MSEEYAFAGQRRTKGDRKAKAGYMKYKRGGKYRAMKFAGKEKAKEDSEKV